MSRDREQWILPPLAQPLDAIMTQLRGMTRGGLEDQKQCDQQEVKGLKFISNRLSKLFEKNRRLKYNNISKILIDNFSSEANDSRNIKRRVYDAINVMVAAGLFQKNGEMLERKEIQNQAFRQKVQILKTQLNADYSQRQISLNNKKIMLSRLNKRFTNLQALIKRNRASKKKEDSFVYPIFINVNEGVKNVSLSDNQGNQKCQITLKSSGRSKERNHSKTAVLKDEQYLQYL